MTQYLWPTPLVPSSSAPVLRDLSGRSFSPFTGTTRTVSRPGGDLLGLSMQFNGLAGQKRALLQRILSSLRGGVHRVWVHDHSYRRRGSFPASELIGNNTFADGTTNWGSSGTANLTVADFVLRSTATANFAASTDLLRRTAGITVTPNAPYVARLVLGTGNYSAELRLFLRQNGTGTLLASDTANGTVGLGRILTLGYTPSDASIGPALNAPANVGSHVGDFVDVPYVSLSRCMLIDNAPNMLIQSDEFDDVAWTLVRATVDDQAAGTTDPLGSSTADSLIEDNTASQTHYVSQTTAAIPSEAADYALGVALKAGARTWARLAIAESIDSHTCRAYFNLTTGVVGTVSSDANWLNPRAVIRPMGDGWYYCGLVARKNNAATLLIARIQLATADNTEVYSGNGTSNIYVWRATLAQSSAPTALRQTTTTANSGTSQTGAVLGVKGLPVSTDGLLLFGDQVQIGDELFFVASALNSDAAGQGVLQLHRPIRAPTTDNAPVIVEQPMGLFVLAGSENGWSNVPGGPSLGSVTGATVELIEAPPA